MSTLTDHIALTEYLKETARLSAAAMLADVDLEDVLRDPEAFARDLLEALLLTIAPLVLRAMQSAGAHAVNHAGLPAPDVEAFDQIREAAMDGVTAWAIPALVAAAAPLVRNVQAQTAAGIAEGVMAASLTAQPMRDALTSSIAATAKRAAAALIQEADGAVLRGAARRMEASWMAEATGAATRGTSARPRPQFTWITMQDAAVCEGRVEFACDKRHGMTATMDQWEDLGLPAAPNLRCMVFAHCRCYLQNAKRPTPEGPVQVAGVIREAKERARAAWDR